LKKIGLDYPPLVIAEIVNQSWGSLYGQRNGVDTAALVLKWLSTKPISLLMKWVGSEKSNSRQRNYWHEIMERCALNESRRISTAKPCRVKAWFYFNSIFNVKLQKDSKIWHSPVLPK
jgi:hypothetical protein